MTKQQIFNIVVEGFAKQRQLSYCPERNICVYKDKLNRKCAIGLLIPDELYSNHLEFNAASSILSYAYYSTATTHDTIAKRKVGEYLFELLDVSKEDVADNTQLANSAIKFYADLQIVHDGMIRSDDESNNSPEYPEYMNFPQRLMEFAKKRTLNTDIVVQYLSELTKIVYDKTASLQPSC
jgi:hypothetical protein